MIIRHPLSRKILKKWTRRKACRHQSKKSSRSGLETAMAQILVTWALSSSTSIMRRLVERISYSSASSATSSHLNCVTWLTTRRRTVVKMSTIARTAIVSSHRRRLWGSTLAQASVSRPRTSRTIPINDHPRAVCYIYDLSTLHVKSVMLFIHFT